MKIPVVSPRNVLVYVHGTNGSGKSTLARSVLAAAGGAVEYLPWTSTYEPRKGKAGFTRTPRGVALLGKYSSPTGGVDGFSPYELIHDTLALARVRHGKVFAEGLITPGLETCKMLAHDFQRAVFVVLNTPPEHCIQHVLARRSRKGNVKPYTPEKLHDKHRSALRWGDRLESAGLEVQRLQYPEAKRLTMELLGLPPLSVTELLEGTK